MESRQHWRACSICKAPIPFGERYHRCSVSTCNRKRTQLTFCSVKCWDAHVPTLRHRDAWAVEETAPSREAWEAEQRTAEAAEATTTTASTTTTPPARPARRVVAPAAGGGAAPDDEVDRDILIVASKLKKYIKQRSGMRTSDGVMAELSDLVRQACDEAIRRARESERSTVLDRDIPQGWRPD